MSLSDLPAELSCQIARSLPAEDLKALSQVSVGLYSVGLYSVAHAESLKRLEAKRKQISEFWDFIKSTCADEDWVG